jgi:glutamate racemase
MTDNRPIGVFDSGVGGLTVVRALQAQLPTESMVYLGDTARVPYGVKSADVVRRYTLNCARFLRTQNVKAIVVACNTATAYGLEALQQTMDVPVLGVITPGAAMACAYSVSKRVGVVATEGTVRSGSYQAAMRLCDASVQVFAQACPLWVPLAEEGLLDHPATRLLVHEYLQPLLLQSIDTLVLGCTHYPVLRNVIESTAGPQVRVIDSAQAVALAVEKLLHEKNLCADGVAHASHVFYATDVGERLQRVGTLFLGYTLPKVDVVDLIG